MGKVIEFKKQEETIPEYCWECVCGSQLFILMANGDVECKECGRIQNNVRSFDTRIPFNPAS